jgi:serine/threonine protein kinase/tetratricopeptide (TPR) repeat protein
VPALFTRAARIVKRTPGKRFRRVSARQLGKKPGFSFAGRSVILAQVSSAPSARISAGKTFMVDEPNLALVVPEPDSPDEEGHAVSGPRNGIMHDVPRTISVPKPRGGSDSESALPRSAREGLPKRVGPYDVRGIVGRGGMGIVYEAVHSATGERVALKTAIRASERSLAKLRQEAHALRRISHPGIVRFLDQGVDGGAHYYVMELLEGSTWQEYTAAIWQPDERPSGETTRLAGNGRLDDILARVRELAEALSYLHDMGLVHCDVSPRNVLVRANGRAVLLDLGLVSRHRGAVGPEVLELPDVPIGTPGYMAPEQILGLSVDARADLYSLGALLHAALTGHAPSLRAPVRASSLVREVPGTLDSLLERLLDKDRTRRPLTTADVIAVLDTLGGSGEKRAPQPVKRLFRSTVFGRENVLQSLMRPIAGPSISSGSFILIAGVSGIGKTALAATLARKAAMDGWRVVTCECVPLVAPAGRRGRGLRGPQLSALRPLLDVAVDCALSGDEATLRNLLRSLIRYEPRAAAFAAEGDPGGAQPPPPIGEAAQSLVCDHVAAVLAELARSRPLLLVLDDLQSADELTMSMLTCLPGDYFEHNRVVVVATYRSEESDDLVRLLAARPYVTPIGLGPLSQAEVREMVAESSGFRLPEPWVQALQDRAGGNPFLVAEYLRAALDDGVLTREQDAATSAREARAFAGMAASIDSFIERRLSALPSASRPLIQLAAVLGNPIPTRLLIEISGLGAHEVLGHLEDLTVRNILERIDAEHHRFMHDKLREVAYESTPADVRRSLHRGVGRAIESRAKSDAERDGAATILAHHFLLGGEDIEKAIGYLERAALVAYRAFANREVVTPLTEALALSSGLPNRDPARMASFHFLLGRAYFGLGVLEQSREHFERMLDLLELPLPSQGATGWLRCMGSLGRQMVHRVFGPTLGAARQLPSSLMRQIVLAYDTLMELHYYRGDDVSGMLHCALAALNMAECHGRCPELYLAYANVQSTAALLGLRRLAGMYESIGASSRSNDDDVDLRTSAWVRQSVQHIVWGEWDEAEARVLRIIDEARAVGHHRREEEGTSLLAFCRFAQGRYAECRELYKGLTRLGSRGDTQALCWSMVFRSHTDLVGDRADMAVATAMEGLEVVRALPGRSEAINLHAILALALARMEDWAPAEHHARVALELGCSSDLITFMEIVAYALLAEVSYGLRLKNMDSSATARLEAQAFRQLGRCARVFPIAVPRFELWNGNRLWRAGRKARARRAWERAASAAWELRTPHEAALVKCLLGVYAVEPRAPDHALVDAQALFGTLGAAFDERMIEAARRSTSDDPLGLCTAPEVLSAGRPESPSRLHSTAR